MTYIPNTVVPVSSSNIKAIAWSDQGLWVEFHHGGEYVYDAVPQGVFENMRTAPSVGKFFHAEIKNKFSYRKVVSEKENE